MLKANELAERPELLAQIQLPNPHGGQAIALSDRQVQALREAPTGPDRDEAVQRLRAGVARATRLVEQLLALAREERAGARARVPVELPDLVREVMEEILPLADARNVDLGAVRTDAAQVQGDPDALRALVRNLLDNAIRHVPAPIMREASTNSRSEADIRAQLVPMVVEQTNRGERAWEQCATFRRS